jgi:hypothetical protein
VQTSIEFPAIRGEYQMTVGEWLRITPSLQRCVSSYLLGGVCLLLAGLFASVGDIFGPVVLCATGLVVVTGWYCVPFAWWALRGRRDIFEAL